MRLVYALLLLIACFALANAEGLARGFNDNIDWVSYSEGLAKSKELNKPLMLLLHKSWCGACKRLKGEFQGSTEIVELSKHFVMVNAEDDEEPHASSKFQIDGGYIPRIFFLTPEEKILDVTSGNPKYKYFFGNADAVVGAMKAALKSEKEL
jgi:protein-disulfide reductase (glutathione)